ncbi:MAG: type II secretion system inner membrane protein GspF [Reinekea forsetii]|jgi:general secretion pathway protein F|uniref:General secretion pathway protein F n=1 Tax=Reinekea forsetii TaxID=1336806 RepID=A0A2K8KPT2_9GAMM|nr:MULTISPECIES: type II secretion system inner membrane protein GspF [Reinekea]ATX76770.1 general secretion pathway protein F [Reinekea forsetii]MDO7645818.1 type II secretion system inner membrane protein GspF [Reinekea forsetii]MDO7673482.1 type II secretion system inner membrane protein GspF [Reinekea forsetii]
MAAFEYVALDGRGKKKKGILEADSARQIRQQLRDKGWFVQEVQQAQKQRSKNQSQGLFSPGLSVADLALVTRQLATLVGSGMPLEECLKAAADQSEKAKVRSLVLSVRSKVLEGFSLANALSEYPRAFPVLYQATVNAGEHSGHLDRVMNRLADHMEEQQRIGKQIQMASIYPAILTGVALLIIVFLLYSVVPEIVGVISSTGQVLPTPTRVLLASSDMVMRYWGHFLVFCIALALLFHLYNRPIERRTKTHRLLLRLPLIGRISKGFNTSRFIGTVAMLSGSGVPLVEAMRISAQVIANLEIKQRVSRAAVAVSEGSSLHKALTEAGYFRPMMLHMIGSGEASGELDAMLQKTADAENRSVQELITTILSLFEPLMILIMGAIVLVIVLAIVLPIMQMNNMAG